MAPSGLKLGAHRLHTRERFFFVVCERLRVHGVLPSTVLEIKKIPADDIVWRLVWVVSICMYVAQNFN